MSALAVPLCLVDVIRKTLIDTTSVVCFLCHSLAYVMTIDQAQSLL